MHIEKWKAELLLALLTYWPWIVASVPALTVALLVFFMARAKRRRETESGIAPPIPCADVQPEDRWTPRIAAWLAKEKPAATTTAEVLLAALDVRGAADDRAAQMRVVAIMKRLGWTQRRKPYDRVRCWSPPVLPSVHVYEVDEDYWYAARSLEDAIREHLDAFGPFEEEVQGFALTEQQLDTLKFIDTDENEVPTGEILTFREKLAQMVASGEQLPALMACREP